MKKQHSIFEDIKAGQNEALEIERGTCKPPSFVEVENPREIREKLSLTQPEFAEFVGVRVATLRNWEQGRRRIPSTARTLLRIAQKYPKIILEMTR